MNSKVPSAILDFAQALELLAKSQGDITSVLTKWDQITNTDTPSTVEITLSDGTTHTVDNLAKIRRDLIAGLSLDEPTVKSIKFTGVRANGVSKATTQYGMSWHSLGEYAFDSSSGFAGVYRSINNDFRTICVPGSSSIDLGLLDMPKVILLGAPDLESDEPITDVTVNVSAPSLAFMTQGMLAEYKHYYTTVTVVNRYMGTTSNPDFNGAPVTIHWVTGSGLTVDRTIKPLCSVTFLMFAPAGGSSVNIQEIVPDINGG